MHDHNLEIELRAELSSNEIKSIEKKILDKLDFRSQEKRLSILFLGSIGEIDFDIRIRITSDKNAELVLKRGGFHTHDRLEIVEPIDPSQFLGLVKFFSAFNFDSKVMQRDTKRFFSKENNYEIALVKAGEICYAEIETILNENDIDNVDIKRTEIRAVLDSLGLTELDKSGFNDICNRLTEKSDWVFSGTSECYERLSEELSSFR